jgi:hypothetical protein
MLDVGLQKTVQTRDVNKSGSEFYISWSNKSRESVGARYNIFSLIPMA